MVTKTYECEQCGQFDHEHDSMSEQLNNCPICHRPVKRVFKKLTYLDSVGFVGKIYGTP